MRICQNFSGCYWAPHPHPANKSLAASATFQPPREGDRNPPDPCLETEYYVFPSLYHKYINYANYEHCILPKSHFLSPFRCYALRAGPYSPVIIFNLPRKYSLFSVIPGSYKAPCQFVSVTHN